METKIFNFKARWLLVPLVLLTLGAGNAWGAYTYSGTGTFNKQSTIDGDGYYVIIFTNSGAMTNSASSNYVGVNTGYNGTSSNTISNPATSVVLQVTNYDSTNKKYYINNNSGNYLYSSGDKKIAYSATAQYWEIATVSSKARLKTAQATVVYMGYYSGSGFRPYANSSSNVQSVSAIYKLAASCDNKVTISKGTPESGGSFNLDKTGEQNCCNALVVTVSNIVAPSGKQFSAITQSGIAAGNVTIDQNAKTVTYAANSNGSSTINVTFVDLPKYTVTLKDDETELTQASAGASVILPSRAGCTGYTFAGWTKSWVTAQTTWTTTAPTIIPAGNYTPTGNENLYPVYTKTESGGGSTTKTYGWEASEPYASSWTIGGTQPAQKNSDAHTGSYAGYINTNNTYVTFNDKVKVTEFSFWLKRKSTNSNYNVYIETSTDGSTWSAAATYAMSEFGNGSYTQKTKTWDGSTAYYVRFHCFNTTAERYVDDISITYSGGSTTYYISVPDCCTPLGTINGSNCRT